MLVSLVYFLLSIGVVALVNGLGNRTALTQLMLYLEYVEDPEVLLTHYLPVILRSMTTSSILSILLSLYQNVIAFGYHSYGLRLARNEQPGYRNLFDGFARCGRVILMMFLISLFTGLWTLLGLLPYIFLLVVSLTMESTILLCLAILAAVAGTVFGVFMGLRYEMSPFILIDQPDLTAIQAISESKRVMSGRVWSLFVLELSFLGWALLSLFTLGILNLWLLPYMTAAKANFYDFAAHGWTGGGENGPSSYNSPSNGPEIQF